MLPSQRRRLEKNARLDAEGVPWQAEITEQARKRIAAVWERFDDDHRVNLRDVAPQLQLITGWTPRNGQVTSGHLIACKNNLLTLDMIAVVPLLIYTSEDRDLYEEVINMILNEERIGHKFVDGELVAFQNDELMQEVVEPALKLLISQQFKGAQKSYREALEQISHENAGNAITDAGTALQETLKALECKGNVLGDLIRDAKSKGILGDRDAPLTEGVQRFLSWSAAERNQNSDAHQYSEAPIEDAWLMVHIVGALIVRLASGESRQLNQAGK